MKKEAFFRYLLWAFVVTIWATICFIVPDFLDTTFADYPHFILPFIYIIALGIGSFWILYLAGLNKYFAAIFLPLYSILGSAVAYFRLAQHASVTPMIIEVTLNTNILEAQTVLSWQLYVYVALNLLISIALIYWRFRLQNVPYVWFNLFLGIGLLLAYCNSIERLHDSLLRRYPYNVVHNMYKYIETQQVKDQQRIMPEIYVTKNIDSLHVVCVIGESLRADHLGLNGYERNTTPKLSIRKNLLSLPNIYSDYTYTSASVPHLLTPTDSIHPESKHTTTSFIACFNHCGFTSAWISNQDYGDNYRSFIHESDTIIFPNADMTPGVYYEYLDEDLIDPMLGSTRSPKHLSVLHTIGSHWYYNNHVSSSFNVYQPITNTRVATKNTIEQLVNSYDNTILYTDFFIDSLISTIEDKNSILIYLSDHGDSLGEEGRYFHANDGIECKHVACMIWYSDKYAQIFPEKVDALHRNYTKSYKTDFLFYSLLSAAGISPVENNEKLDLFSSNISTK